MRVVVLLLLILNYLVAFDVHLQEHVEKYIILAPCFDRFSRLPHIPLIAIVATYFVANQIARVMFFHILLCPGVWRSLYMTLEKKPLTKFWAKMPHNLLNNKKTKRRIEREISSKVTELPA